MKIRTLHHLSATGGTLISHALGSLQNVYLIGEINPLALGKIQFQPADPFQQFAIQYRFFSDDDYEAAFLERLRPVIEAVRRKDGFLVIRDHSHSDWLERVCRGSSALMDALSPNFDTTSIVTLRHPIEAYASMMKNGWHHPVGSFDAYCGRINSFLDYFSNSPLFYYEDFVCEPDTVLAAMCQALELPFSPDWRTRFGKLKLTGHSGGMSNYPIQPLPVRRIPEALLSEVRTSGRFTALARRIGYTTDLQELIEKRTAEIERASAGLAPDEQIRGKASPATPISKAQAAVRKNNKEISRLRDSIENKKKEISRLRASISRKNNLLVRRNDSLADAKAKLRSMKQSRSWKLMAPLRTIKAFFFRSR